MSGPAFPDPRRAEPFSAWLRILALLGGLTVLGVACVVTLNVTLRGLADTSLTGAFDLVKIGAAMCVFLFLPLCQARRGNIMVDTFTSSLPAAVRNSLDALWDLVYAGLMAFVSVAMFQGAREQMASHVQTTQLAIPIWPFNLAASALLMALAGVCVATALRLLRQGR